MSGPAMGGSATSRPGRDPLAAFGEPERAALAAVADRLIPAAHGMPSAAEVLTDERLRFVLNARPDLVDPALSALRPGPEGELEAWLDALGRDHPAALGALQLLIVGGYYTDKRVRELIGYPGQEALTIRTWELPPYLEEGLIDAVLARGAVWRDPSTGKRAVVPDAPRTYADRFAADDGSAEGGNHGHDRA